jgi:hypothetical protein
MSQPIKLENLRDLVSMGAVKTATILGQKGGFAVVASMGMQERVLANKLGKVKMFATSDTALKELHQLGLVTITVNMTHYEKGSLRPARTDVTRRAKEAAEALAHDQWFRAQVDEALDEEARGVATWHTHEDVWADLLAETAQLVQERDAAASGVRPKRKRLRRVATKTTATKKRA